MDLQGPSHRTPWQSGTPQCTVAATRKRPRASLSPGVGFPLSDPELPEFPQKRHVSECMASDLNRHMSLASCSSDEPSTSEGLLSTRAPTPPHRPLSVTGIRQTSSQGPRPTHSDAQGEGIGSDHDWQPMSESGQPSPPTSGITGDVTFPVRSPGSSMGGATSHASHSEPPTPHIGGPGPSNTPWLQPSRSSQGGAPLSSPASDAAGQQAGTQESAGLSSQSPASQGFRQPLPVAAHQVSEALMQSLSPGAMMPPPSPGTSSDSSNVNGKPRPVMLRPTPTQMQMQDLMPPSPSDARFLFTDLRKAALLRSFKQRTEDSCAMQITSEGLPQDVISVAADTAPGMQAALLGRETVPSLATQLEIKLPGALMPPPHPLHSIIIPADPSMVISTIRAASVPELMLTQHTTTSTDSPPIAPPHLNTSPPPLPPRTSFSGSWGSAGQLQLQTSGGHSLPAFRPRGSSPIARADSFMETINSLEGSSSSGSDEDAEVEQQMRRSQPVVLGPAGIAPLPTSFLGFPDPGILHRQHQHRSAGGAGHPAAAGLLPGTSPPDNLMLGPLVGTPAPHFSMGAHVASMRSAHGSVNKLSAVPECIDKEMNQ